MKTNIYFLYFAFRNNVNRNLLLTTFKNKKKRLHAITVLFYIKKKKKHRFIFLQPSDSVLLGFVFCFFSPVKHLKLGFTRAVSDLQYSKGRL